MKEIKRITMEKARKEKLKKRTRIAQMRAKYASNQQYIQKVAGLNDLEYYSLVFETACAFLEEIYPDKAPYKKFYEIASRSPQFWLWWKSEWKKWEGDYVIFLQTNKAVKLGETFIQAHHQETVKEMINDGFVLDSYEKNFLNIIINPSL